MYDELKCKTKSDRKSSNFGFKWTETVWHNNSFCGDEFSSIDHAVQHLKELIEGLVHAF